MMEINPNRPYIKIKGHTYEFEPGEYIVDNTTWLYYLNDAAKNKAKFMFDRHAMLRVPLSEKKRIKAEYKRIDLPDSQFGIPRFRIALKLDFKKQK